MSWLVWVLTANSTDGLPAPLLSRVPPTQIQDLSADRLTGFALRRAKARGLPPEVGEAIAEIVDTVAVHRRPSLRTIIRMVDRAEAVAHRPVLH